MNNAIERLGVVVRKARKKKRISQRALAAKLSMSVRTIMDIENGRSNPKFETVAILAEELDIDLGYVSRDTITQGKVPSMIYEFFDGMNSAEAEEYISLCKYVRRTWDKI